MKKSYEQYKTIDIEEAFGIEFTSAKNCVIDKNTQPYLLTQDYKKEFFSKTRLALAIDTEKARSELIVSPILFEVRKILDEKISLFSGITFDVEPSMGLKGRCDFLISLDHEQMFLKAPIMSLVEAKNDNIKGGLGQCFAVMVAAQIFNSKREIHLPIIYGVVTTGANWRFLKLIDKKVFIETEDVLVESVELIFGILLDIIHQNEKFIKK